MNAGEVLDVGSQIAPSACYSKGVRFTPNFYLFFRSKRFGFKPKKSNSYSIILSVELRSEFKRGAYNTQKKSQILSYQTDGQNRATVFCEVPQLP
jgi:hypothetical protein